MMISGKLLGLLPVFLLISCAQVKEAPQTERVVYVSTPLFLPERPQLPKMRSDALSCISDDSKWTLLKRDVILKEYISELETIITSTQIKAKK